MQKWKKIIIVVVLALFLIGTGIRGFTEDYSPLENFQQVLYLIKTYHVEDISIKNLVTGAINGMVEELDPYSSYMLPDEYNEMQTEFEGHFGGIGIVITVRNKELTIISPIKGTPGDKAGLKAGDIILAVNGDLTSEMSQNKAVDMMRGEPGTSVTLTIKREDNEESFDVEIIRADIQVPYVEWEMKTDDIGYIAISEFVQDVGAKVEEGLQSLQEQGARAVVLDLRNDPGGLLDEAIRVASNFIDEGVVVSIKQREGENRVFETDQNIQAVDLPMVVLVNGGSASASEIVSGAIKDYNRGKLIGTKTFGKGTVQTVIPLNDGSALRLTTARYYTPSGSFIHEKGINPDIEIEYDEEQDGDNQLEKAVTYLETQLQIERNGLNKAAGE